MNGTGNGLYEWVYGWDGEYGCGMEDIDEATNKDGVGSDREGCGIVIRGGRHGILFEMREVKR